MRYEVKMRDGSAYEVDAAYIEVHDGPADSSYALLGQVPGFPIAIVAAFPVEMVETIMPAHESEMALATGGTTYDPDLAAMADDMAVDDIY
jgi:hypothetical protein